MHFRDWLETEGATYFFMLIWLCVNGLVFAINYKKYGGDDWAYLRLIVGEGLQVARGAANVINLNSALILLPVCRNFLNFVRGSFEGRSRAMRRLVDRGMVFHRMCGYMICVAAVVHIGAHLFNINNIVLSNGAYSRVSSTVSWEEIVFGTPVGLTGIGITVALILMVTTAVEQIRRSYFELFWYTHHFFVLFYGCMLAHGASGFVERQTNYARFPVGCLLRSANPSGCVQLSGQCATANELAADTFANCCPCQGVIRQTEPGFAQSWYWLVGPIVFYTFERLYRSYMCQTRQLVVVKVVKHQDATPVMEINLSKIATKAGQYVFLNCSAISNLEWHPFTLTSSPELDFISVHIRIVGDWTGDLAEQCGLHCVSFSLTGTGKSKEYVLKMLEHLWPLRRVRVVHVTLSGKIQHTSDKEFSEKDLNLLKASEEVIANSVTTSEPLASHLLPTLAVDGPFGTSSEDMHNFKVAILVGAGIGITPFASLLKGLYFRLSNPSAYPGFKTKKVHFFWLCQGFDSWGWFSSLLMDLEEKLASLGLESFLEINIHMTRGWTDQDAKVLMLQDNPDDGDTIVREESSGRRLKAKMQFGRPMWDKIFFDITSANPNTDVASFICGPKALSEQLHDCCKRYTDMGASKHTRFFHHKENF